MTRTLLICALAALAACGEVQPPQVSRLAESAMTFSEDSAPRPPGAETGSCWARDIAPRTREESYFETPCAGVLTADFVTSLQRALSVRGFYAGGETGEIDLATREAIRAWQEPRGLDSAILSMTTAKELGLVAYGRPGAEEEPEEEATPGTIY